MPFGVPFLERRLQVEYCGRCYVVHLCCIRRQVLPKIVRDLPTLHYWPTFVHQDAVGSLRNFILLQRILRCLMEQYPLLFKAFIRGVRPSTLQQCQKIGAPLRSESPVLRVPQSGKHFGTQWTNALDNRRTRCISSRPQMSKIRQSCRSTWPKTVHVHVQLWTATDTIYLVNEIEPAVFHFPTVTFNAVSHFREAHMFWSNAPSIMRHTPMHAASWGVSSRLCQDRMSRASVLSLITLTFLYRDCAVVAFAILLRHLRIRLGALLSVPTL